MTVDKFGGALLVQSWREPLKRDDVFDLCDAAFGGQLTAGEDVREVWVHPRARLNRDGSGGSGDAGAPTRLQRPPRRFRGCIGAHRGKTAREAPAAARNSTPSTRSAPTSSGATCPTRARTRVQRAGPRVYIRAPAPVRGPVAVPRHDRDRRGGGSESTRAACRLINAFAYRRVRRSPAAAAGGASRVLNTTSATYVRTAPRTTA